MMEQDTKDRLSANVGNAWKMASNWAMATFGTIFAIYLGLPVEQQQEIVAHLPVPPWALPIAASVVGIAARLWPQRSLAKQ